MNSGVMSIGQIAKLCHVAPRTVINWINSGKLKAYRIPVSKHRRAKVADVLAFLKEYDMPFANDLGRVL